MPRRHRRRPRSDAPAPPAAPSEELEVWGREPSVDDLPPPPPPPPAPGRAEDLPSPPPAALVELGPPPVSERSAQRWGYRALMLQVHDAAMDASLSAAQRRKEVRTILAAAAKLYPDAARAEVADTIDSDKEKLEARRRAKAAGKLEARAPADAAAKVIPIRRDG